MKVARTICLCLLNCILAIFLEPSLGVTAVSRGPMEQLQPLVIAGDPLTIHMGANSSLQVFDSAHEHGQVYGDADSGVFVWLDNRVYGPNLPYWHSGSSAANPTLDYVMRFHQGPTGHGTRTDPWVITTGLTVGMTGLDVTQRVSYVDGDTYLRLAWEVENRNETWVIFDLFHAADTYLADDDYGYGAYDLETGAVGTYSAARDWWLTLRPGTAPDHYMEAYAKDIWNAIGTMRDEIPWRGPGLSDTVDQGWVDSGLALQWHREIGPYQRITLVDYWTIGNEPAEPVASETPSPTETATSSSTIIAKATSTPTLAGTLASPTDTSVATMTPSLTLSTTPTAMASHTPMPTPTATAVPAPTATPPSIVLDFGSGAGDLIFRIEPHAFLPYDSDSACDSALHLVTVPPAPQGWQEPGYQPDDGWREALPVWWLQWEEHMWDLVLPAGVPIGWLDPDEETPQALDNVTHLIRRTFELVPPAPGYGISSACLEMASDNKTAWWWQGELFLTDREGSIGEMELYPSHVGIEGGSYLLAVQNSNDRLYCENPHGTAYHLIVTWTWGFQPWLVQLPLLLVLSGG